MANCSAYPLGKILHSSCCRLPTNAGTAVAGASSKQYSVTVTWRLPQNVKYIIYCTVVWEGLSHIHIWVEQKIVWFVFEMWLTDIQTCSSQYFAPLQGQSKKIGKHFIQYIIFLYATNEECFFWYRLTRVVLDKIYRALKRLCVCVCVCVCATDKEMDTLVARA